MRKIIVIGLILAFAFLAGAFVITKLKQTPITPTETPPQAAQKESIVEVPKETQVEKEKEENNDYKLIQQEFSKKYSKPVENVNLTINRRVGNFAQGGVTFEGEYGGAGWLAVKEDGNWIIVFDGNGAIPCADVAPYNFPAEFIPGC